MSNHIKNVAIVGGTGRIGGSVLSALLATKRFSITSISRADSKATFPSEVNVKRGDYDDRGFLESALHGQDAFIITLGIGIPPGTQAKLIEAAGAAGVKWIIPNEFGSDNLHPVMGPGQSFVIQEKLEALKQIPACGSNYIAYVNGCWYDYSLGRGSWGIDVPNRTATIYGAGDVKASTTTLTTAGQGVARLLSLPITTSDGSPCLSDYKNQQIFVEGMQATQREMLHAAQRATNTTDKDWKVDAKPVDEVIAQGSQMMKDGNFLGFVYVLYGLQFKAGSGGDFHDRNSNAALGMKGDELDEATRAAVRDIEAGNAGH